ncbi:pilus assembly protein [Marilutibacter alkalisoli]|uniref:Pilus assembly protein n=1 Tax=Marilutibacter alkalisoli TaxID=2591633 RepID=A0A514BPX9_9GAMM|nr:PilC/PilY family type IV pilus protein [Lysobacter alkalisoli]QDH69431.1 pilus assembly protein [Lysobacter alkalisoli]
MNDPVTRSVPRAPRAHPLRAGLAACLLTTLALPVHAAVVIPDVPLQSGSTVSPNIMFILDDSGSMQSEVLPDESIDVVSRCSPNLDDRNANGIRCNNGTTSITNIGRVYPRIPTLYGAIFEGQGVGEYANAVADPGNVYGRILRTAMFNPQYYDPKVIYRPWVRSDGTSYPDANPAQAYWNPEDPDKGAVNLAGTLSYANVWWQRTDSSFCSTRACFVSRGSRDIKFNVYYEFTGDPASPQSKYNANNYVERTVSGAELQNFANWFQYYRSRILASRGGIGRAFSSLPDDPESGPRVGYATINTDGAVSRYIRPFAGTDRQAFYDSLYGGTIPNRGTPLRKALYDVGKHFETETGVDDPWRTGVGNASDPKHSEYLACRQNFAMLMTDGYWNGADSGLGNEDGTAGYPFSDGYGNTLADVAYHFWNKDLRADIPNEVPASPLNPNTHQHMVTYGIGLGVFGRYTPDYAFGEIGKTSGSLVWPDPFDASNPSAKIDDLLHAAVNSRGDFFSAGDPETFAEELTKTLSSIIERTASGSNVAANSVALRDETRIFQASYVGGQWTGQLASYPITANGVSATPSWRASDPGKIKPHTARRDRVFTPGGTFHGQRGDALGSVDGHGVADYLLGDRSGERSNDGPFRNRNTVLGDIIHSSPAFSSETATPALFVGANDGMLHAFHAENGEELFAYVPGPNLISNDKLKKLSDPDYSHEYYVDGPVTVSTQAKTPNKNLLVGTLGRGGRGVFALDVSSPSTFTAANVLWEASSTSAPTGWTAQDRADLGLILSRPLIVRTNARTGNQNSNLRPAMAIFGNGLNSESGNATLFAVDAETGQMMWSLPVDTTGDNGITSIQAWDEDGDGIHDYVFAADLKGNVWKFDLDYHDPGKWGLADGGQIQGQVRRAAGGNPLVATGRPITGGLQIAFDPMTYERWVFFGTGKYLEQSDTTSTGQQRWYGIKDTGSRITGDALLTERKIEIVGSHGGRKVRAFEPHAPLPDDSRGWYVNLEAPAPPAVTPPSERMVSDPLMVGRVLVTASILPDSDPCKAGGTGYMNAIDAFTGTSVRASFFDVNGNGSFDDDVLGVGDSSRPIGSVDLDIAMPTSPTVVESLLVAGGSLGTTGSVGINPQVIKGRISWREIIGD